MPRKRMCVKNIYVAIRRAPPLGVHGGLFEFALSRFAHISFELRKIRIWLALSPSVLTRMEDLKNVA